MAGSNLQAVFGALPEIDFAVLDPAAIVAQMISDWQNQYLALTGESVILAPANPNLLNINVFGAFISMQRTLIDQSAKQGNSIAYGQGAFLDTIGTLYGTAGQRLQGSFSIANLQFTLSTALTTNSVIPAGTQVATQDGLYTFATQSSITIPAGSISVTTSAACTVQTILANGYGTGTITQLLNWSQPFLVTVTNTTASSGGAAVQNDTNYAQSLYTLPTSFGQGNQGRYQFYALSASPNITDAEVWCPSAGVVYIAVLENGVLPDTGTNTLVSNIVTSPAVRVLSDNVVVVMPTLTTFTVNVTFYISPDSAAIAASLVPQIEAAVTTWVSYTTSKLGRNINPSSLIADMINAGASRVTVATPSFSALTLPAVGSCTSTTVTYGGIDSSD